MYAILCAQLEICFAVGLISRCQSNPGLVVWWVSRKWNATFMVQLT